MEVVTERDLAWRGRGGRKPNRSGVRPARWKKLAPEHEGSETQSSGSTYFIYVLKLRPLGAQHLQGSVSANTRSPGAGAGVGPLEK